jgi:LysR family transcriptional regulator, nitrogen assimilation regulatory protein
MNFDTWKLFIDAAELGSLSKAAVAYRTSQPHISRRIGELERECGGRLFQRTGRGVALTELGQRVAPRIRAWLASTEQLANDVRSAAGTPIGTVRIASLPSTAHPLVTSLYYRVKKQYPLIQLQVREGQGAQLETWLDEGSVDLAVLYRSSPAPRAGDVYLVETPTYLVAKEGDELVAHSSVPFAALDGLPLVLFCRPSEWRNRLESISAEHGIRLNVVLEADSLSLQTQVVADGNLYALLGPYAISAAARTCRLQAAKIVKPAVTRHIALAMSRHGELTLACRTVMKIAREIASTKGAGLPVA